MSDYWEGWQPTARLRWAFPPYTVPSEPATQRLQQLWQHEETGRTAWRLVPIEVVEAPGSLVD